MQQLILIVEDDPKIANLVAKNLEAAGYRCKQAHDGPAAVLEIGRVSPALVVLDIMLPRMDGLEVTRRVRRVSDVPILMLTARGGEADKVLGFEVGADDYLTKPFSTLELVSRVRALLRRATPQDRSGLVQFAQLAIDPERRKVTRRDLPVALTSLEFDVLHFLASHPGRVYTREALMEQVWGEGRVVDGRSIDSLISRLRKKIEADISKPAYIQTVWGAGYRFTAEPE